MSSHDCSGECEQVLPLPMHQPAQAARAAQMWLCFSACRKRGSVSNGCRAASWMFRSRGVHADIALHAKMFLIHIAVQASYASVLCSSHFDSAQVARSILFTTN
eukprot:6462510-Amphidinium_carterae.1